MKKENLFTIIRNIFSGNSYKKKQAESLTAVVQRENIWGQSGRKTQMDSGTLMQMKPFTNSNDTKYE